MWGSENVACRGNKKHRNNGPHACGEKSVHARRRLDALNVEPGKHGPEKKRPSPIRNGWCKYVRLLAAPDDANHRVEHVIHHHAPSGDVAEHRVDLLSNISKR